jgi:para-nitrobenzyl esterase
MKSGIRLSAVLCLSAAASLTSPAMAQLGTASVTGGQVQGVVKDGIAAFKGIAFAAPPVGALRWKSPQPVLPWQGVRKAEAYAPSCMQEPRMLAMLGAGPATSEDCLYLNVWTGARSASEKRPVMVWIYGGAFAGGMTSSPVYEGVRFANSGVVLVSVAYRVGPFGFLAQPEATREGGGSSGNYGLQDMIAGLQWVQKNIAAFGGDPGNVTIFGESAGGIAVSMLAASPLARGLFHRAISESGGNFGPARRGDEAGVNMVALADAERAGVQFLARLGAGSLAAARALPAEKIQAALAGPEGGRFWPNFDGKVLPGDQYLLYEKGRFNDTPVLIGTNSDEGALFVQPGAKPAAFEQQIRTGYKAAADALLKAYPHADDAQAHRASKDIFRDFAFAWPTWAWARLQAQHGRGKAYVYYFDHHGPQSQGATHAAEIPYVFGTLGVPASNPGGQASAPTAADQEMSRLMHSYWVNFARSGDPNGPGLPSWPPFDVKRQQAMILDAKPSARLLPNLEQLQAMDAYYRALRAQAAGR